MIGSFLLNALFVTCCSFFFFFLFLFPAVLGGYGVFRWALGYTVVFVPSLSVVRSWSSLGSGKIWRRLDFTKQPSLE